MGLGLFFFDRVLKKPYYKDVQFGLLTLNWFVQRILRINSKTKQSVHFTTKIHGNNNLRLNSDATKKSLIVSGGCFFSCLNETITIGENTIFSYRVAIIADNHDVIDKKQFHSKKVSIGKNCWLATGVTILPGVTLGDNVTVGANSVVTKSFESNVVIAGNPAKIIRVLQSGIEQD